VAEQRPAKKPPSDSFRAAMAVMNAIPKDKSILHGEVPCPVCGGTVRWARSPINGHRRAACDAGCVSFME
jgi:hypothetical protein